MDAVSSKHCVGTPGLEYPLLLCLGKSLVVIHNYALTAERPDPYCPEPYSPGKRPWTHSPLGKGPVAPRIPGAAVSQNSWAPRTSRGVPDLPGVPDPCRVPDPRPTSGEVRTRGWGHYHDVFQRNLAVSVCSCREWVLRTP